MTRIEVGTKFEVVKGGGLKTGMGGGPIRLRVGEIWDIVGSDVMGPQFRKLNQRGGSTCILNGMHVAACGLRSGQLRVMCGCEPKFQEHDELRKRTGAR
jgi:hypothetical protein